MKALLLRIATAIALSLQVAALPIAVAQSPMIPAGGGVLPACTGGTITIVSGKVIHDFTAGGTLVCNSTVSAEWLVVGGGGGGGAASAGGGGGGGGGGGDVIPGAGVLTAGSYPVVAAASVAANTPGNSSSFNGVTAAGGGEGGHQSNGGNGASGGGGGGASGLGGTGSGTHGFNGGSNNVGSSNAAGGGGGAGALGGNASGAGTGGNGGSGFSSSITGSAVSYGPGGGGGANSGGGTFSGGSGGGTGGGNGGGLSGGSVTSCSAGTANTGAGGGGGANNGASPGAGCASGSGRVIVSESLPTSFDPASNTNSGTLSNNNLTYLISTTNVVRSFAFNAKKTYFEVNIDQGTVGGGSILIGVVDSTQATVTPTGIATVPIKMWGMRDDSFKINNGVGSAYGSNFGAGSLLSVAFDNTLGSGSGKLWIGLCSAGTTTWYSSGNPVTGANAMFSNLTGNVGALVNYQSNTGSPKVTANFGATAYGCTPPSGYGSF